MNLLFKKHLMKYNYEIFHINKQYKNVLKIKNPTIFYLNKIIIIKVGVSSLRNLLPDMIIIIIIIKYHRIQKKFISKSSCHTNLFRIFVIDTICNELIYLFLGKVSFSRKVSFVNYLSLLCCDFRIITNKFSSNSLLLSQNYTDI